MFGKCCEASQKGMFYSAVSSRPDEEGCGSTDTHTCLSAISLCLHGTNLWSFRAKFISSWGSKNHWKMAMNLRNCRLQQIQEMIKSVHITLSIVCVYILYIYLSYHPNTDQLWSFWEVWVLRWKRRPEDLALTCHHILNVSKMYVPVCMTKELIFVGASMKKQNDFPSFFPACSILNCTADPRNMNRPQKHD